MTTSPTSSSPDSPLERRKSFGIGGAGNIRRPSVIPYAHTPRTTDSTTRRRRSSVWSTHASFPTTASSSASPREKILGWFGKKQRADYVDDEVKYEEVDFDEK